MTRHCEIIRRRRCTQSHPSVVSPCDEASLVASVDNTVAKELQQCL